MPAKQLKLFVDETVIKRLHAAARRYGHSSGNMVAVQIIDRYLPFWEELQEVQQRAFEEQRDRAGIGSSLHAVGKKKPA